MEEGLRGDWLLVPKQDILSKPGILFIEARIRDYLVDNPLKDVDVSRLSKDLERQLSSEHLIFELLQDILKDKRTASLMLGPCYENAQSSLESLKVVEYHGPRTETSCFSSNDVRIKIQAYALYKTARSLSENKDFPQAEITPMPHAAFDGRWDELVFEEGIKEDLIWMMTNILRFSQRKGKSSGEMNPIILLYGPPGTGKTSLCQGLAQKISIRLHATYKHTKLVQIKTATLLSKFYSESAKQVDEIFTRITRMCQENPDEFVCVLIDEVESIANSREFTTKHGESQDSLRATNALLTGLDRTKGYPNVIFLCTSNMFESLDPAFLDRCGLKRSINRPTLESQYEILRGRVQKLISQEVIQSVEVLPSFEMADLESVTDDGRPGSKLLRIVKLIQSQGELAQSGAISGRSLTQLPEQAIMQHLREEDCSLDLALEFIERTVLYEQRTFLKEDSGREHVDEVEVRGRKRSLKIVLEEDCNIELLEDFVRAMSRGQA